MGYIVTHGSICGKQMKQYHFDKYIDACLFLVNDANETYHCESVDGECFLRFKKHNTYAVVYNQARNAAWFWEVEKVE